jgi:hypothetical protein
MAPTNYDDLARQVIEGRLTDTVVQAPFADYHCPHGDKDDWASDCHQCQCAESRKAIVAVLAPDYAALTQARDDYREAFEEWQARAEAAEAERDALRRVIRPVIAPATIAISDSGCTCDNCKDALASLDELDRLLAAETGGQK